MKRLTRTVASAPMEEFLRDYCTEGGDCWELVEHLFLAWESWCQHARIESGSRVGFVLKLKAARQAVRRVQRRTGSRDDNQRIWIYQGVQLSPDGIKMLRERSNLLADARNSQRQSVRLAECGLGVA